ncbi:hypothetical protein CBER1_03281 [Cercospora berteroae]|uniref:BTB domain-containing protein n=1 Tax=Cercospora berteroae TaxID=357750 RepID=A0A2S6C298_9PEZI|nr:hypothetical protein CBER1_03281 [Cercospora berteroae]
MSSTRYHAHNVKVGEDKIAEMPTNLEHLFDAVHKSIVCTACPFLRAACSGDWKEAQTGVINLPETEYIVRAMLAYCYGLFSIGDFEQDCEKHDELYQLPALKALIDKYMRTHMDIIEQDEIAAVALWAYEEDRRQVLGPQLTRAIIRQLAWEIGSLVDNSLWPNIQSCPELLTDVFRFVAQGSSRVCEDYELPNPDYLCVDPEDRFASESDADMFDNCQWSDLKAKTATHTFEVHKSVVCPASPFFEAACSKDWKEARTGVIELSEPEHIVRALLEWCYGLFFENDFKIDIGKEDLMLSYCKLLVAADKYELPDLKSRAIKSSNGCYGGSEWTELTTCAIWLYEGDRRNAVGSPLLREIIRQLAVDFEPILNGDDWPRIQSCPELTTDLVRFVAQRSSRLCNPRGLENPAHLLAASGHSLDSDTEE